MSTPLKILTGPAVEKKYLEVESPAINLNSTSTIDVVEEIARTYIYSYDNKLQCQYVQVIYTFQLLAAVLDTAPTNGTQNKPVVFQMNVGVPNAAPTSKDKQKYVVDAVLQTAGNSTRSPTYVTNLSAAGISGVMYFPVTNFFSVTTPGAPYTITITLTKQFL